MASSELGAIKAIVQQYATALTMTRTTRTSTGRLEAYRTLWDVLERAEVVRASLDPDADQGARDALDTLHEYWAEIRHLPEAERMERETPEVPVSLARKRAIEAYHHTVGRTTP